LVSRVKFIFSHTDVDHPNAYVNCKRQRVKLVFFVVYVHVRTVIELSMLVVSGFSE